MLGLSGVWKTRKNQGITFAIRYSIENLENLWVLLPRNFLHLHCFVPSLSVHMPKCFLSTSRTVEITIVSSGDVLHLHLMQWYNLRCFCPLLLSRSQPVRGTINCSFV